MNTETPALQNTPADDPKGLWVGASAYTLWGLFPLYFSQLSSIAPIDILAWRIVLSVVVLLVIVMLTVGAKQLIDTLRHFKRWSLVVAATLLISVNWYVFIYAIAHNEILQSSLGYFLVPIINVAIGMLVFGEKPNILKKMAMLVALAGMLLTFAIAGIVPWLSLLMAASFGLYGMVRKLSDIDSLTGLFLETLILLPLALGFVVFFAAPLNGQSGPTLLWVALLGLVTVMPLLAMGFAVRLIRMSTLGFLQYIAPCMHYLIAVFIYSEVMDIALSIAFATTLIAVTLWSIGVWNERQAKNALLKTSA